MADHADNAPQAASADKPLEAPALAQAWLWMDVTTSFRARPGQMNGTLRVEQSYAAEMSALLGSQLRFCRYQRTLQRFLPLDACPDLCVKPPARAVASRRQSVLRDLGRSVERTLRRYRRDALDPLMRALRGRAGGAVFAGGGDGAVLLLAGENWGQYDFDALARLRRESRVRIAAVALDLLPIVCPQFYDSELRFVARYRAYADFLVQEADLVVAISQATKADIENYARDRGGVSGRIAVIQLGADLPVVKAAQPPAALPGLAPQRYVLSVSNIQPRKNYDLLYRLWRDLAAEKVPDLPLLIIVGQRSYGGDALVAQITGDPLTKNTIRILPRASDEELAWLYRNCLFTLYPSLYEGWGLPVSESLAYGKYCLASNTSSLPEAGAGLIAHLDPRDLAAWREAVLRLIGAPERLHPLEHRIRAEYRPMTWKRSAELLAAELAALHAQSKQL
jgi:glycosyltransferase involved in cell wall biosynthesis